MPRTALFPTIALGCLALFLVLSAWSAGMAFNNLTGEGSSPTATAQRSATLWTWFDVDEGDDVVLTAGTSSNTAAALPYARILVLEGGEGQTVLDGGQPRHILFETHYQEREAGEAGSGDFSLINERFTRPDIYDGKPHAQSLNGDLYDAIDVVVLVDRPAGMDQATWSRVSDAAQDIHVAVTVGRQPWVALQYVWYTGMAVALLAAIVGMVGLARHRPQGPAAEQEAGLGALVAIHGHALEFLRSLKATMLVAGALLAVGGAGSLGGLNAITEAGRYQPFETWLLLIMGLGILTWILALVVWSIQYRRISREVRRWQATPSPLDA